MVSVLLRHYVVNVLIFGCTIVHTELRSIVHIRVGFVRSVSEIGEFLYVGRELESKTRQEGLIFKEGLSVEAYLYASVGTEGIFAGIVDSLFS